MIDGQRITEREMDIIVHAAHGLSDKEIARLVGVRLTTVRTYWDRIRTKLGGINRTHCVCLALGLITTLDRAAISAHDTTESQSESVEQAL